MVYSMDSVYSERLVFNIFCLVYFENKNHCLMTNLTAYDISGCQTDAGLCL